MLMQTCFYLSGNVVRSLHFLFWPYFPHDSPTNAVCGNSFANSGALAAAGDCTMLCNGDNSQICGGPNRLTTYNYTGTGLPGGGGGGGDPPPGGGDPPPNGLTAPPTIGDWHLLGCYTYVSPSPKD